MTDREAELEEKVARLEAKFRAEFEDRSCLNSMVADLQGQLDEAERRLNQHREKAKAAEYMPSLDHRWGLWHPEHGHLDVLGAKLPAGDPFAVVTANLRPPTPHLAHRSFSDKETAEAVADSGLVRRWQRKHGGGKPVEIRRIWFMAFLASREGS